MIARRHPRRKTGPGRFAKPPLTALDSVPVTSPLPQRDCREKQPVRPLLEAQTASMVACQEFGTRWMWIRCVLSPYCFLNPTDRLVLITLSQFGDKHGEKIHPSQMQIASSCGLSARRVREGVKRAEATGWIMTDKAGFRPGRRGTKYRLALPTVPHNLPRMIELEGSRFWKGLQTLIRNTRPIS